MLKLILAAPLLLTLSLVACSSSDDDNNTTPTPQSTAAATQAAATATTPPGSSPAASPTSTGSNTPPIDGTVAPQNAGDTVPVTIKANPDPASKVGMLDDVRVGAHPEEGGWDRIVFEFSDILPAGEVKYVTSATQCGSGEAVTLPGDAILQVSFTGAQAHTDAGQSSLSSTQITGPGNVILESHQICDFEGHVTWAIGLKSEQRFKVTMLQNPTRVVIDIKQ
jgi:hypothetical protein